MTREEELQIANFQDVWSKLYFHLANRLVQEFGIEGEVALRKGIRNFGIDRGEALKQKHLETGLKLNLFNLFTYYDLPGDPRFRRNKIRLTPEERLSETLTCPIAETWINMGGKKLGRIYCEEFHHAMFSTYAPKSQINLSQTLTQDGDNHCRFSVYLRPGNMDEKERRQAFAEFDASFKPEQVKEYKMVSAKKGFKMLCIKLYQNITDSAIAILGDKARNTIINSTREFASDTAVFLQGKALLLGMKFDVEFVETNCPISIISKEDEEERWNNYTNREPRQLFENNFYEIFKENIMD